MRTIFVWFMCSVLLMSGLHQLGLGEARAVFLALAVSVPIDSDEVLSGQIVSISGGRYVLSSQEYDSAVVGVVDLLPAINLDLKATEAIYPVVSEGHAYVRVSQSNGVILAGDWITSSSIQGVGMKASGAGYVIGQALEGFSPQSPQDIGEILVSLEVRFLEFDKSRADDTLVNLITDLIAEILSLTAAYASDEPSLVFRYLVAAIIILIVIIISYFGFARVARNGIVALGRNPLAKNSIITGIVLNVAIAVVIVVAGMLVAYFIVTTEQVDNLLGPALEAELETEN